MTAPATVNGGHGKHADGPRIDANNLAEQRYMVVIARPTDSATLVVFSGGAHDAAVRALMIAEELLPSSGRAGARWRVIAVFAAAAADMLAEGSEGSFKHRGCIHSDRIAP